MDVKGLAVLLLLFTLALGDKVRWTGDSHKDNFWDTPANWDLGFVPSTEDDVTIARGVVSVSHDTLAGCQSLTVLGTGHLIVGQNLLIGPGGALIGDGGQLSLVDGAYLVMEASGLIKPTGTLHFKSGVMSGDWVSFGKVTFEGPDPKALLLSRFVNAGRLVSEGPLQLNTSSLINNGTIELHAVSSPGESYIWCIDDGYVLQSDAGTVVVASNLCRPQSDCQVSLWGSIDFMSMAIADGATLLYRNRGRPANILSLWLSGKRSTFAIAAGGGDITIGDIASSAGTMKVASPLTVTGIIRIDHVELDGLLHLTGGIAAIDTLSMTSAAVNNAGPNCTIRNLEVVSGACQLSGNLFNIDHAIFASSETLTIQAPIIFQGSLSVSPLDWQPAQWHIANKGSITMASRSFALIESLQITSQDSGAPNLHVEGSVTVRVQLEGNNLYITGDGEFLVEAGQVVLHNSSFHAYSVILNDAASLEGNNSSMELHKLSASDADVSFSQGNAWLTGGRDLYSLHFPPSSHFLFVAHPITPAPKASPHVSPPPSPSHPQQSSCNKAAIAWSCFFAGILMGAIGMMAYGKLVWRRPFYSAVP